jgi:hypothetical protein
MLPEEEELAKLEDEHSKLKEEVTSLELMLETIKTETAQFEHRYYQTVGRLYTELDLIDAQIASLQAKQFPDDLTLQTHARSADEQAKKTAEEVGLIQAQPDPPPMMDTDLKDAYRRAVKLMHPDLGTTNQECQRRTELMAQVNLAKERSDRKAIEKLIKQFGEDPEMIVGEDIGSRIVKVIRRNGQLRRRLSELQQGIQTHQNTKIFQLKQKIQKAEAATEDPLGDLARQLRQQISERKIRMEAMRRG